MTWQAFWFPLGPSLAFPTALWLESTVDPILCLLAGQDVFWWKCRYLLIETESPGLVLLCPKRKSEKVRYICSAQCTIVYVWYLSCVWNFKIKTAFLVCCIPSILLQWQFQKNHITSLICLMNIMCPSSLTFSNPLHVLTFRWMFH